MFGNSNIGIEELDCVTSISISLSSSSPARSFLRKLSRVAGDAFVPTSASKTRSSAASCARACTSLRPSLLDQRDADLEQVADDLLDIAADIADLGEFRRLDFEKRRARELGEPAGNLGLAATGRADHQDVFRQHLFAHRALEPQAAPAIAQGDRHGAFGILLPDDEAVEFGDDFARRKISHFCK